MTPPTSVLRAPWTVMALVGLLLCVIAPAHAEKPAALTKTAPESVDDLKAIQKQLQSILDKVVPCTVGVQVGNSSGSGVIVSAEGHVLTAGHVSGEPNKDCYLIFPDGKKLKGKTLGRNEGIDSGMIKINEGGPFAYCDLGDAAKLPKGAWCVSVGHPGGFIKGRSPVVRLGRVLEAKTTVLCTDCTLVGGDSGGPLFDMEGRVIGIHSRIGGRITENYHVPVETYKESWDRLVKAESWGNNFELFGSGPQPYVGMRLDIEAKDCKVIQVREGSPAEKAGLKVGDVVLSFNKDKPGSPVELLGWLRNKKPGDELSLEVQREKEVVKITVVVGKR